MGLGPVAVQILGYLSTHRDAEDTVEGIAEWWLLEQRIRCVIAEVKKALAELAANGLVLERTGGDGRVRYRLNPRKRQDTAEQLRQLPARPAPPRNASRTVEESRNRNRHGS